MIPYLLGAIFVAPLALYFMGRAEERGRDRGYRLAIAHIREMRRAGCTYEKAIHTLSEEVSS